MRSWLAYRIEPTSKAAYRKSRKKPRYSADRFSLGRPLVISNSGLFRSPSVTSTKLESVICFRVSLPLGPVIRAHVADARVTSWTGFDVLLGRGPSSISALEYRFSKLCQEKQIVSRHQRGSNDGARVAITLHAVSPAMARTKTSLAVMSPLSLHTCSVLIENFPIHDRSFDSPNNHFVSITTHL